ncbi:hemolysin family protein [bacterium 210820-DFI.6.52]|uniref:DUF21 domain-containing protein n=1 Tax=Bittarella massiliensis (ex Durand et al. 2017) TaxID=1720313 RepID=A0AAQ1MC92_9FIRM|nr:MULTISPECIES: hemolysin family protein [Eubacteriales]MCB5941758.1 hemolysin family protein [bacterium 210820-DFI.6.52]ERI99321.1 hypothetical protein HMPREF0262_01963 [Clostridium sp. ATCC 29733]MZL68526.1 DUF21 domain-containing protein [Bittarella massiliensis (ex Durand et al. 2017)]MZL79419.1 DUF21 domain-containing protein [Bittarella massiliensis (ex Durand et al. 2017)]SHF84006.1 putative hemolysin [Bittarella massiliensis (ex Durand et al. 2017)]
MDSDSSLFLSIAILLVLIATNAFFAMSEIAVISVNEAKVQKLADGGSKAAGKLLFLTRTPSNFLSTIQVGITLSGFLASAVAADNFAGMLADALSFLPVDRAILQGGSLVLITLLLSYFTIVFGELVPKRIAMRKAQAVALRVAGVISLFYRIARPFVWLLAQSTNGILRLLGQKPGEDEEEITPEDVLLMVETGTKKGVFDGDEKELIENIFAFDDKTVGEVMTHRTDVSMVEDSDDIVAVKELARREGYSRIPVYHETADDVVGILYVKDLLDDSKRVEKAADCMRAPIYVPESMLCSKLLRTFQKEKVHMAIVVDEYGGTAGIVTMEDLLEDIVGDIADEYDREEADCQELAPGRYLFAGSIELEEVEEILGIALDYGGEYDTLAGLLIEELGYIPQQGDATVLPLGGSYCARVARMEERRIDRVLVWKEEPQAEEAAAQ